MVSLTMINLFPSSLLTAAQLCWHNIEIIGTNSVQMFAPVTRARWRDLLARTADSARDKILKVGGGDRQVHCNFHVALQES